MKNLRRFSASLFALVAIFFVSGFFSGNMVQAAMVNINTANLAGLETIPGVGPAIGQRIIDYRIINGPFIKIEDIINVKGIGDTTFAKMKDYITVTGGSDEGTSTSTPPTDGENDDEEGNDTDTGSSSGDDDSAHYEQESLSNYSESVSYFKVSAGRERMSYVGSPVLFEAKYKIPSGEKAKGQRFTWSFGDGLTSTREKIDHIYLYPGEYNVVLNAEFEGENSVSRTMVKVLESSLAISEISDGSVEIKNNGKQEINLYNWSLVSGTQKYVFPLDTIISAGQKTIFPIEYTKFAITKNPWLMDATGKGVTPISMNLNKISVQGNDKTISIADFERLLLVLKKDENSPVVEKSNTPVASTSGGTTLQATAQTEEYWSDRYEKNTKEALSVNLAKKVEAETGAGDGSAGLDLAEPEAPTPGFWSKVFHPVRTIKEAFYK